MAQLIVLDASVAIAALAADDRHHEAAATALAALTDTDLVIAATTRAEILVGPSGTGAAALAAAQSLRRWLRDGSRHGPDRRPRSGPES